MLAKDVKNGAILNYEGAPIIIESITVQSPSARGANTLYKFKARNLQSRQKVDLTCKGTDNLDEADFARRAVQYLYADPTHMHFMDVVDYNQFAVALEDMEHERQFIIEGLEGILALIYNDECIGIQVPSTVELKVVECDPGIRGNSATARTKPAKLETGLIVQVPEYLSQDEVVKVDTRTCEFLSRA